MANPCLLGVASKWFNKLRKKLNKKIGWKAHVNLMLI
jgi:hypothetical protein